MERLKIIKTGCTVLNKRLGIAHHGDLYVNDKNEVLLRGIVKDKAGAPRQSARAVDLQCDSWRSVKAKPSGDEDACYPYGQFKLLQTEGASEDLITQVRRWDPSYLWALNTAKPLK